MLIDPYGQPIDVQTMAAAFSTSGLPNFNTGTMQFFRRDPVPGRWLFVLLINNNISGAATSRAFQAVIGFNGARLHTAGIPNSVRTVLPAGKAVRALVQVGNTGLTSEDFFLNPRLAGTALAPLLAPDTYSVTLPITIGQVLPPFLVPRR